MKRSFKFKAKKASASIKFSPHTKRINHMLRSRSPAAPKPCTMDNEYWLLIEHMPAGIVLHTPETHILLSGREASQLLGISSDRTPVKSGTHLVNSDKPLMKLNDLPSHQITAIGEVLTNFIRGILRHYDGRSGLVLVKASPKYDSNLHLQQVAVTFTDVGAAMPDDKNIRPEPEHLAAGAALAIEKNRPFDTLRRFRNELVMAYDATIEGWSRALDLRDNETESHSQRVADLTVRLAGLFGISGTQLMHVRWGALLHDIGKMGVPDEILPNHDKLTEEEWTVMKKHPVFAYEMLSPIGYLRPALAIPYTHHEKWDGTGYPCGLKGEQIPLAARIFAIADVWDALRSARTYRPPWPLEKVREHIRSLAGTHFDPHVVFTCFNADVFEN